MHTIRNGNVREIRRRFATSNLYFGARGSRPKFASFRYKGDQNYDFRDASCVFQFRQATVSNADDDAFVCCR